jgi:uncharacterized protein YjbI with pentapeptide repeats
MHGARSAVLSTNGKVASHGVSLCRRSHAGREGAGGEPRRRWRVPQWTGFRRKTLWDWLQLLIVPAILVGVTFVWSATQTRSDNKRQDRRIAADRVAAEEARRDATLQAYLEEMSRLMLDRNLLTSRKTDAVRPVARIVTLTTLRRLNGERRAAVLHFLYEARLIAGNNPVVALDDADFSGADLALAVLEGAHLERANLEGGKLTYARLTGARFEDANLRSANLFHSYLGYANLLAANLSRAKLIKASAAHADLSDANLKDADLRHADLEGAGLSAADLEGADLRDADLTKANLTDANLTDADLTGADLKGADLDDARLEGAHHSFVEGLDLARFIAGMPPERRKAFFDSEKHFLDSLSAEELSKFNLSPEKLAKIRREAAAAELVLNDDYAKIT